MNWGDEDDATNDQQRKMQDVQLTNAIRKVPCHFFSTRRGCSKGDECKFVHERICAFYPGCKNENCNFIHDESKQSSAVVKICPTKGCGNQCLGKICRECHQKIQNSNQNNQRQRSMSPVRQANDRSRRDRSRNDDGSHDRSRDRSRRHSARD